jgi:hypothetical protein
MVHFEIKEGCWGRIPWRRALGQRRVRGGDRWRWSREGERERESFGREERKERKKKGDCNDRNNIQRRAPGLLTPYCDIRTPATLTPFYPRGTALRVQVDP